MLKRLNWGPLGASILHILFALFLLLSSTDTFAQHPSLPPPVIPEGFGVNIHFTDPEPGELEKIAAAGIRWIRMDLSWNSTEPQKGIYDFSAYDRLTEALQKNGLKALYILDYGNPHYDQGLAPYTEEGRQAFARWALTAAQRYRDKGYLWEIWNEPNHRRFWSPKPSAENYARLAVAVGKAFKNSGLKEALIGPGTAHIPWRFLKQCFQGGVLEYFSAISVHPYRLYLPPETSEFAYRRIERLIRKYSPEGKNIPLLSSEWGYSTAQLWINETDQANYLARMWLINLANGLPLSIWYDWKDDGDDPKEKEHRFGMVRRNLKEKPAYQAAKTLNEVLRNYRMERRLFLGGARDYVLAFQNGDKRAFAVWSTSAKKNRLHLPLPHPNYRIIGHLGDDHPMPRLRNGAIYLTLSESPQYILPQDLPSR